MRPRTNRTKVKILSQFQGTPINLGDVQDLRTETLTERTVDEPLYIIWGRLVKRKEEMIGIIYRHNN